MFIIPYDLGLDGYLNADTCSNSRRWTYGMPQKVMSDLRDNKYFKRYGGADHVILWSLGQYHPWPHNGCDQLMKDFCEKCTITCYWMDPTKAENRFVSLPFPSSYHWYDGIKNIPLGLQSYPQPSHKSSLLWAAHKHLIRLIQRYEGVWRRSARSMTIAHGQN